MLNIIPLKYITLKHCLRQAILLTTCWWCWWRDSEEKNQKETSFGITNNESFVDPFAPAATLHDFLCELIN